MIERARDDAGIGIVRDGRALIHPRALHRVRLARARLAVRKHGAAIAEENFLDNRGDHVIVNVALARIGPKDLFVCVFARSVGQQLRSSKPCQT